MLCGVPHESITADILSDIQQSYKGASVERIFKSGQVMRVVKVKFTNSDHLIQALSSDGIYLKSQYLKCHFAKIVNE